MAQKNIIELNGKQYDARTGAVVGMSTKVAQPAGISQAHRGRAVDGFSRGSLHNAAGASVVAHTPATDTTRSVSFPKATVLAAASKSSATHASSGMSASPKRMDVARPGIKTVVHHPAQKPQTLMRSAVKKPNFKLKPAIKTQAPAEVMAAPIATIVPKLSATHVSPTRLERAAQTRQSAQVRRFNGSEAAALAPAPAAHNLAATTAQKPVVAATPTSATLSAGTTPTPNHAQGLVRSSPAAVRPRSAQHMDMRARPAQPQHVTRVATPSSMAAHAQHAAPAKHTEDIFEAALAHATSHEQVYHKPAAKPRFHIGRRLATISAGIGVIVVLGGFVAYANMPNIEIRMASMNAGFHAQLPGYRPTGYALDNSIKSTGGKVSLSYRSGDSTLSLTQQPSNWDSQTLFESAVALNGQRYKTVQSQGRTLYIYDQGDTASWVNAGIRYDITGTADLTTDQITNIATSM